MTRPNIEVLARFRLDRRDKRRYNAEQNGRCLGPRCFVLHFRRPLLRLHFMLATNAQHFGNQLVNARNLAFVFTANLASSPHRFLCSTVIIKRNVVGQWSTDLTIAPKAVEHQNGVSHCVPMNCNSLSRLGVERRRKRL